MPKAETCSDKENLILGFSKNKIGKTCIQHQKRPGYQERVLQAYILAEGREDECADHVPECHRGQKDSGASADASFLKQPGDVEDDKSAQETIPYFVNDPEEKGKINIF